MASNSSPSSPTSWRRNLAVIIIAEFIVLLAFSFVTPFIPLFIQQLGNYSEDQAAFWAGIAQSAAGIAMFISSPLWGLLADRIGRKPMVLRAQFGSAVILSLAGLSPNVYFLIGARFLQGALSGTVAAASALVAAATPRDRLPFAMGTLLLTVYAGNAIGPALGGVMADAFGFQATFFITGGLRVIGGLIVLFFVKEDFKRPEPGQGSSLRDLFSLARSREILPLLLILAALNLGPGMLSPIIPLSIAELGTNGEAAGTSGVAFALMGVVAACSALVAGRLARRVSLTKMLVFCCVGTGLLYLPPLIAHSPFQLVAFVALTGLLTGGIVTASNSLVGLSVPLSRQGAAYGLSQSANSLGGGLGPLLGGGIAPAIGLRNVFAVAGALYVAVGAFAAAALSRRASQVNRT